MATTPDIYESGLPAPANENAERTLLGAVLLDNAAYTEASLKLTWADFSLTAHQRVWQRMGDLITSGHTVDIVTLCEELARRKELESVGGVAWLASLTEGLPRRLSIGEYVRIVREKALLRRLITVHSDAITRAADQSENAERILSDARTQIESLTSESLEVGLVSAGEFLARPENTAESMMDRPAKEKGVATGIREFDEKTCGLQKGEMVIVAARPSMGKAQPLSARVLTPRGFVEMGSLRIGSVIVGADGSPQRVMDIFPQGLRQDVFEVEFSDGTKTSCTDDHLWFTQTRNERRRGIAGSVKRLSAIRATLQRTDAAGSPNHAVPSVEPIRFVRDGSLLLDPYVMGVLLGDGTFSMGQGARFSNPEPAVHANIRAALPPSDRLSVCADGITCIICPARRDERRSTAFKALIQYGLIGHLSVDKFIPPAYLRASIQDRFSLLRGLIDTDGHVNASGRTVEFSTSSERMSEQVAFLARSLGLRVSVGSRQPHYRDGYGRRIEGERNYRVRIWAQDLAQLVSSEKHRARVSAKQSLRVTHKNIVAVRCLPPAECQCIRVSNPDGLYVTDDFILTHNTDFAVTLANHAAVNLGKTVALFSLEMTKVAIINRMIASAGRIDRGAHKRGRLSSEDRRYFQDAWEELRQAALYVDDRSHLTLSLLRSECQHLKARRGLDLIVVDYLGLMSAGDMPRKYNREQEVAGISRGLKLLAKELEVPAVVMAQLSRDNTKRTDKRPILSDLRESGAIEQDADLVAFLHREEYYDPKNEDARGKGEIIIAKQRNGPTGTVETSYDAACGRWADVEAARDHQEEFNAW